MLTVLAFLFPAAAGIYLYMKRQPDGPLPKEQYILAILFTDMLSLLAMAFSRPFVMVQFARDATLYFAFDGLGRYFLAAVLILYTAVTFYSFEYLTMEENQELFFLFYFLSLSALIAACGAGNMITVYFFFEMATLTTMPLVLHERTREAVAAAVKYLFYSMAGALMGLLGIFAAYVYGSGDRSFVFGGFLDQAVAGQHRTALLAAVFIAIIGFGTKAGMYPMHGWLPTAHPIAPAPASALLSGIVVKAGVLAVIRLVYYSVGPDFLRGTWVQTAWMCLCMLTIFMGSMMAYMEKIFKKRLAYSSISQLSYILLGLSTLSTEGLEGGLLHVMQHTASKGCLFLVAGIFIYKLGVRNVDELKGIGRRMPVTMWCFTIAALSLVGIPPLGGFLSKWVIASAAIRTGSGVMAILPPAILLVSALLTAGYLLPITISAFFPGKDFEESEAISCEPSRLMTIPMICLCFVTLVVGLFGSTIVGVLF